MRLRRPRALKHGVFESRPGRATDRSNGTQFGTYGGDQLFVDSLFSFNAQLGQSYSGAWADDSTFVIKILDPSWRAGPQFESSGHVRADSNCTVAPRDLLVIKNQAGTCDPLNETSPMLTGDAGLDEPPVMVSIVGDDPDLGDSTISFGDELRISFDRATNLGCTNYQTEAACPYLVGANQPRGLVSELFNFSVAIGADYGGSWTDDSTFVLRIFDGTGSELNAKLGTVMVNPIAGAISNQGCRPGVTDRNQQPGLCNAAFEYVGPIVARQPGLTPSFVASFGVTPAIVRVEVDDPDHGDTLYGPGDKVSVYFSQATDRGGGLLAGNRAYVDSLFTFSMPLGLEYEGEWADDSIFVATVLAGVPIVASDDSITVTLVADVRDSTSQSRPSVGMANATEDEKKLRSFFPVFDDTMPYIVNVSAEDYDNGDSVYGEGDIITITYNYRTDRGAYMGNKDFVDRLFRFDPPLGTDYTGEWSDDRTFQVRALDTVGGELRLCNHAGCTPQEQSNVTIVGVLRNRGGTSSIAQSSTHLSGVSDRGAPELERFEVSDPDNLDYVFSNEDQVMVTFDRSSDLGAVEATRKRVDALFSFNIPLGEDYSGLWLDDSTFIITITDTRYDLPLINETVVTVRKPVRSASGLSGTLNGSTSVTLQGNFGHARRPRLFSFYSRRARENLGARQGPVYYTLSFSELTNRTCTLCGGNGTLGWSPGAAKSSVDEIFAFSAQLGATYWGDWVDGSTFEIEVIEPLVNMSIGVTPTVGVTAANLTGIPALFSAQGLIPASTTELVTLDGDPAELLGPDTDADPEPIFPHVQSFQLLDAGAGGLRDDGSYGPNATFLLVFNTSAHRQGAVWSHFFINENISSAFPGGVWSADGIFSALEGLQFSEPLGARYTGEWLTRSQFLVTIVELAEGSSMPRVGSGTVHTRFGGTYTTLAVLQTSIGSTIPPKLLAAVADDPDNLDYVYSSGDIIDIIFDTPTNAAGGQIEGDKSFVDELLAFTQTLAYDYSGAWLPAWPEAGHHIFRITILQQTCPGCTPMPTTATVKPIDTAAIRTRSGSSPRSFASSPPLDGDYGKTRGPQIVSFVADDFDNGDSVFGSGVRAFGVLSYFLLVYLLLVFPGFPWPLPYHACRGTSMVDRGQCLWL